MLHPRRVFRRSRAAFLRMLEGGCQLLHSCWRKPKSNCARVMQQNEIAFPMGEKADFGMDGRRRMGDNRGMGAARMRGRDETWCMERNDR